MKDLEKIKSEDLAAQVQDANPANFAIEQEVAALVGATVPQPTEPSADDARELGAQLLVFLRRALLPIRTALRIAVAAIYAHLDSRCTDYTPAAYASFQDPSTVPPYDPMRPLTPRTLPNLLTALTAFSARKISAVGVPDGIPFMTLMTSKPTSITKIGSTEPYDLCYRDQLYAIISALPNLNEMEIHCKRLRGYSYSYNVWFPNTITKVNGSTDVFELPELERFDGDAYIGFPTEAKNFKKWSFPKLKYSRMSFSHSYNSLDSYVNDWVEEIDMPVIETFGEYSSNICLCNFTALHTLRMAKPYTYSTSWLIGDTALIDIEFTKEVSINTDIRYWDPTNVLADADKTATFLQNFKEHIAIRLTANGSGKTLTLSQAVFSAVIEGSSPICDDIKGIIEDKGWKVQDTNNNIFPTT